MPFLSSSVSHQATNFKKWYQVTTKHNTTQHNNNKTQDCYIKYNLKTTTILRAIIYPGLDFCFFTIATNIRTKVNLLRLYQNKSTIVLGSLKQVVLKTYKLYTQANRYTIYCQLSQNPRSVKKFFQLSVVVANTYD
jgi:predicted DNA binding protein